MSSLNSTLWDVRSQKIVHINSRGYKEIYKVVLYGALPFSGSARVDWYLWPQVYAYTTDPYYLPSNNYTYNADRVLTHISQINNGIYFDGAHGYRFKGDFKQNEWTTLQLQYFDSSNNEWVSYDNTADSSLPVILANWHNNNQNRKNIINKAVIGEADGTSNTLREITSTEIAKKEPSQSSGLYVGSITTVTFSSVASTTIKGAISVINRELPPVPSGYRNWSEYYTAVYPCWGGVDILEYDHREEYFINTGITLSASAATPYDWQVPDWVYTWMPAEATKANMGLVYEYYIPTSSGDYLTQCWIYDGIIEVYPLPADSQPLLTVSYTLTRSGNSTYTGDNITAILNWSSVSISVTATPRNGANLKKFTIVHNGETYTSTSSSSQATTITKSYTNLQTGKFVCRIQDSRNLQTEVILLIPTVAYVEPTISFTASPPDSITSKVGLSLKGAYFDGSFGSVTNTKAVYYQLREYGASSWESWIQVTLPENDYASGKFRQTLQTAALDYHKTYQFRMKVVDQLNTVTTSIQTVVLRSLFDWDKNNFQFNIPILLSSDSYGSTLPQTGVEGQIFIKI